MMFCQAHNGENTGYEITRHIFMEKIAHGIDEYAFRIPPIERGVQSFRVNLHVCKFSVPPKAFCHSLRVAMSTSGAHLGTPCDGVPGGVCPLDNGVLTHAAAGKDTL